MGDPTRPFARHLRAARAYKGLSRAGLGAKLGLDEATIGRYERGEWTRHPSRAVISEAARATELPEELVAAGWLNPDVLLVDPATRFGGAARREAERQPERPEEERELRGGGDASEAGR